MNRAETLLVLAKIAAIDNRRLDPPDADLADPMSTPVLSGWHELIGHLNARDAVAAIANHRRTSNEWLTPAHVIAGVKKIREDRIENMPPLAELMADVDLDLPGAEYAAIYRERQRLFADGGTVRELRAIKGGAE